MVVAILTAKRGDIHELGDLLFMPEFLFILLLLWLIVKGAGALSADHRKSATSNVNTEKGVIMTRKQLQALISAGVFSAALLTGAAYADETKMETKTETEPPQPKPRP